MFLSIDFSCKICGSFASARADVNDVGDIKSIVGSCPKCGNHLSRQDEERIRHFADVVMTTSQRNSFGTIRGVFIAPDQKSR